MCRTGFLVALLLAVFATTARAAQTITDCTDEGVQAAIHAGGEWTFGCDADVSPGDANETVVAGNLVLDAAGYDVHFYTYSSPFKVTGSLELIGVDISGYVQSFPLNEPAAKDGTPGARTGTNVTGLPGTDGGAGENGRNGQDAEGGCFHVTGTGHLTLRDLTVSQCGANATSASYDGGDGGKGGAGDNGTNGSTPTFPQAGAGGTGGTGGHGGSGGIAGNGGDGGDAKGGAIFSDGRLDVYGVTFSGNGAVAGAGGAGGTGGSAGDGGPGGTGGSGGYYGGPGGLGGDGGQPGVPTPGGDAGDGGDALGGAIYTSGPTTISGSQFVGNSAIGGGTNRGGYGGEGGNGVFGLGGSGSGAGNEARAGPGANIEGQPGAHGGDTGHAGNAHGGAVYFAGEKTPATNTVSSGNTVKAGTGARVDECAPPTDYDGCTRGGRTGMTYRVDCAQAGFYQQAPYPKHPSFSCGLSTVFAAPGKAGSDGVASDPDVASVALEADFEYSAVGPPGEYRFESKLDLPAAFQPLTRAWDFGDGETDADFVFTYHTFAKPGVFHVKHSATDVDGRKYATSKDIEVKAPKLGVSVILEDSDLPGGRLSLESDTPVRLRVSASCDGVGTLKDLAFDGGVALAADPDTLVEVDDLDAPSEPFSLEACSHRDFTGTLKGLLRGDAVLRSTVTGTDAADHPVTGSEAKPVKVGADLAVTVTTAPAQLHLDIDPQTQEPIAKPVKVTVVVENVSGAALHDVDLDLQARNRSQQPTNTRGLHWVSMDDPQGGAALPLVAEDDPATLHLGDFATGAKATRTFNAKAVNKAVVRVTGIARASTVAAPARAVSGNGSATVLIDQPKLIAVDGGPMPASGLLKPGDVWRYEPVIKNISPDEPVLVRVLTDHVGNVYGRPILDLAEPPDSELGDIKVLEPGEKWLLGAQYTGIHDGGTRGTIKLEVDAWTSPYKTTDAVDTDRFDILDGALSRTVSVNDKPPDPHAIPFDWAHAGDLGWMFSANFVSAGLRSLAAPVEMVLGAPAFVKRTAVATWYGAGRVWSSLNKQEISQVIDELGADLQSLGRYDTYAQARAVVDAQVQNVLAGPANAYYNGDAGYFVGATGSLLGSLAGDALTAKIGSAAYAKFLKEGFAKRALERSFAEQAATLAGRTAGIGEVGRAGLKAGDLLNFPLARRLFGIDRKLDEALLDYCRRNKLIIAMRDRSPGSILRLAEGLLPKIEKVKAKNVNWIDIDFLGFAQSHLDVAMIKQMPDWETVKATIGHLTKEEQLEVFERWTTRKKEWDGPIRRELEAYHARGSIPVPGGKWGLNPTSNGIFDADQVWSATEFKLSNSVEAGYGATKDGLKAYVPLVNSTGKKGKGFWALTGDMDAIAILDENMQLLSMERRVQVYQDLARMGFQHPESMTWDNAIGRAKYLYDYDLANKKASALLAYTPSGERRAVYFDSRKSTWELAGAAGARRGIGDVDDAGGGMFMLDGAPMSWDAPLVPITPYSGDITQEEDPDAPMYLTPAGEDGATLTNDPGAPVIRRNEDGSYSEYTPSGGRAARASGTWKSFTRPAGVLRLRTQTGVRDASAAGVSELPVFGSDDLALGTTGNAWFVPGATIMIDPGGAAEETRTVNTAGDRSLTLSAPLEHAHAIGELVITVTPRTTPTTPTTPTTTATTTPAATATPKPAGPVSTPAPADTVRPALTKLKLTRKKFSLKVSEAAVVKVTVAPKRGKKLAFTLTAKTAGALARKLKLKRGRYKVTIIATDAAGNKATLKRAVRLR